MENIIEIKNLTKKFKEFTAVDSISCQIKKGEVFGLLGPNGAGKSTVLQALAGLLPLSSGSIKVGARNLDDVTSSVFVAAAERPVGYVFQNYRLFPHLDVADNVSFAARAQRLHRGGTLPQ